MGRTINSDLIGDLTVNQANEIINEAFESNQYIQQTLDLIGTKADNSALQQTNQAVQTANTLIGTKADNSALQQTNQAVQSANNLIATKADNSALQQTNQAVQSANTLIATKADKNVGNLSLLKSLKKTTTTTSSKVTASVVDNPPLYVMSINNDSGNLGNYSRNLINLMSIDNLMNKDADISFNGKPYYVFDPQSGSGMKTINFTSKTLTYNPITANHYVINLSALTTTIIDLVIGDSLSANTLRDEYGNLREFWDIASKMTLNSMKDNIDKNTVPIIQHIGHLNVVSGSTVYKGNTLNYTTKSAAKAGWAAFHFRNHAMRLTSFDDVSSYNASISITTDYFVTAKVSFHLLGLKTLSGHEYSGSDSDKELIRTTIQGRNAIDHTVELYNWMKSLTEWTTVKAYPQDAYVAGDATQIARMDSFNTWILDNSGNPFYSKTKAADTTKSCAFSLSAYLTRYGLVTPNRVTLGLGENDWWIFKTQSFAQIAQYIRDIANEIIAEYPTMKVVIWTSPRPGTNFPYLYENGVRQAKSDADLLKPNLRAELIKNLGVTSTIFKNGNIYYADAYMVMNPLSHQYDKNGENAGSYFPMNEKINSDVHFGLKAVATLADYLYAFLQFTTLN